MGTDLVPSHFSNVSQLLHGALRRPQADTLWDKVLCTLKVWKTCTHDAVKGEGMAEQFRTFWKVPALPAWQQIGRWIYISWTCGAASITSWSKYVLNLHVSSKHMSDLLGLCSSRCIIVPSKIKMYSPIPAWNALCTLIKCKLNNSMHSKPAWQIRHRHAFLQWVTKVSCTSVRSYFMSAP